MTPINNVLPRLKLNGSSIRQSNDSRRGFEENIAPNQPALTQPNAHLPNAPIETSRARRCVGNTVAGGRWAFEWFRPTSRGPLLSVRDLYTILVFGQPSSECGIAKVGGGWDGDSSARSTHWGHSFAMDDAGEWVGSFINSVVISFSKVMERSAMAKGMPPKCCTVIM